MPRDNFFANHAAEIRANMVMAQMEDVARDLIKTMEPTPHGDVNVELVTGSTMVLRWDYIHQSIAQVEYHQRPTSFMQMVA